MAYKFQLGKAKLSGSIETAQAITSQGGLTVVGTVALDNDQISNAELVNSTISGKELGTSLDTLSAAVNGGLSTFSYDGSGAVTVAVTSSIAGAGLAWSAGVLSVDTAEIAAGLSGSVEAMIGAFVEGSDFVTFDDGTGTIGVDASKFSGSFGAALASKSTTNLTEGSNLYYTDTRARNAVSAVDTNSIDMGYDSSTGAFSGSVKLNGTSLGIDGSGGLRTNQSVVTTVDPNVSGSLSYNNASGQFDFKPVGENWVRQRLSAIDAVKYNVGSGSFSLQLTGTSLFQNASGLQVQQSWVRDQFSEGAGLDYSAGVFSVQTAGITNGMLANPSLSVVAGNGLIDGGSVSLGGSVTLNVSASSANAIVVSADGIDLRETINGDRTFTGTVTIHNLNVTGTLTTINTTELLVKDALIEVASGSVFAAGQGIRLGTENSLQTVSDFADVGNALSSSLPLVAPSIKAGTFYGSLEGSMLLGIESKSTNATISKNVTKATANITLTLPTSPVVGQEHRVKCFVDDGASPAPAVIVAAQAGGTIEGVSQVVLESYGAAVSLVWDGTMWMVF